MNVDQWTLCKVTGQHKEPFSSVIWNPRLHIYEIYAPVWEPPQPLSAFAKTLIVCAVIWSLCELPFEVLLCQSPLQCAVCIASKLLWLSLGLWALFGTRALRILLGLCCAASAIAIAFGFDDQRRFSKVGMFSLGVECALKAIASISLAIPPDFPAGECADA